jgi:hypothetical protein
MMDDEDRQIQRIREKQIKKEMLEFQKQLRLHRAGQALGKQFSELDAFGKGTCRPKNN